MQEFFHDGTALFHQGDRADHLFLILHGQVCISAGGIHLVARGPFSIIGEQAFIHKPPKATALGTRDGSSLSAAEGANGVAFC